MLSCIENYFGWVNSFWGEKKNEYSNKSERRIKKNGGGLVYLIRMKHLKTTEMLIEIFDVGAPTVIVVNINYSFENISSENMT